METKELPIIKTFEIAYDGKAVSLNQYKSDHWRKLKPKIDSLYFEFALKIKAAKIPKLKWFELHIEHNTRLDNDNITGTSKPFVDSLVKLERVKDDNKRHYDYLTIRYNRELQKGRILFRIVAETLNE